MQKHCSLRQLPRRSLRDLRRKRGSVGGRTAALSMNNQRSNGSQFPSLLLLALSSTRRVTQDVVSEPLARHDGPLCAGGGWRLRREALQRRQLYQPWQRIDV